MNFEEFNCFIEKNLVAFEKLKIGKSGLGKDIFAYHIGVKDTKQILITAGMHAREYISSLSTSLIMKNINSLEQIHVGIWYVPVVNPDGIELVLDGLKNYNDKKFKKILKILNNNSKDFSLWKSNARGVDLNVNFDSSWGGGKENTKTLGSSNFIGYFPNSEVENQNLINLVGSNNFELSIAFHTKGEVIYYCNKLTGEKKGLDYFYAKLLGTSIGYEPMLSTNSTGGLSDYLTEKYNMPSITIELGEDKHVHPISFVHTEEIYNKIKYILIVLNNYFKS